MRTTEIAADTVIIGGGMAGLVSAVRAQETGADVVLLEKGSRFGGSMYLSTGAIWTYDSYEAFRENVPNGDPKLQRVLNESISDGYEWLDELGVELAEPELDLPGTGHQFDPPTFTERMVSIIEDNGGTTLLETAMDEIRVENGRVHGVTAHTADGKRVIVDSPSVVLATGGFQGNEDMVERYITSNTEALHLRANPWSTGDGLEAATDVGAKMTKGLSKFYGHSLPANAQFSETELSDVSQYYGPISVTLDEDGERFTDESESELEAVLIQDITRLADGRAFYVIDSELYEEETEGISGSAKSDVERAREADGRVAECETLAALGDALSKWGVNGEKAVETIREYNQAIRDGNAERLDPPRTDFKHRIDTPPFYAVEVQPGITYTMGGLDTDEQMRVQRRSNSAATYGQRYKPDDEQETATNAIPGLYAAGIDVGNVHYRTSSGGLSQGLVTGRIAGKNAAEFAAERR